MDNLPSIDLLNNTHRFPCAFIFKAIGLVEKDFAVRLVAAVRDELAHDVDPPFSTRSTPSGKHVSVTIEPTVQSAEEVIAVYRRIRGVTGLVMVF